MDIEYKETILTNCNHPYCNKCFQLYLKSINKIENKNPTCACCREQITKLIFKDEEILQTYITKYQNLEETFEPINLTPIMNNEIIFVEDTEFTNYDQDITIFEPQMPQYTILTYIYYILGL